MMVNLKKFDGLLSNLKEAQSHLKDIARYDRQTFLNDATLLGAAKYYLQTGIESCIHIGSHIIASEGFRAPNDYRDVFTVLHENRILTQELAATLRLMTGLRNRLVHLYWEVDNELIYAYLQERLGDFDRFAEAVKQFVKKSQNRPPPG